MNLHLTDIEKRDITTGLQTSICLIETGTPFLRARDIAAGHKGTIIALTTDQMRVIIRLEELIVRINK